MILPAKFRKLSVKERRACLREISKAFPDFDGISKNDEYLKIMDAMVENAVGAMPVPVGLVPEIIVNGKTYVVPLATEEPSVIAAASFAASIINRHGGFTAQSPDPISIEQIFVGQTDPKQYDFIKSLKAEIISRIEKPLQNMKKRGGGFKKIEFDYFPELSIVKIEIYIDTRDAMGANILNSVGEELSSWLRDEKGCDILMAILSNSAEERLTIAGFSIPCSALARGGYTGAQTAERIVTACQLADSDPKRAVTHNKGIMNGISALALACGNDVRALESAAHFHACADWKYKPLTSYRIKEEKLHAGIEIPLPLAIKGGATKFHPAAAAYLEILDLKDSRELALVAASLGLAQNFAALFALVTEGIQKGHMRLHARKSAYNREFE